MSPLEKFGVPADEAERIWPSPVVTEDSINHQNAIGVGDPRERNELERAVYELSRADRFNKGRNPEDIDRIKAILAKYNIFLANIVA